MVIMVLAAIIPTTSTLDPSAGTLLYAHKYTSPSIVGMGRKLEQFTRSCDRTSHGQNINPVLIKRRRENPTDRSDICRIGLICLIGRIIIVSVALSPYSSAPH